MLSRVYETAFLGFLFSAKNLKITYHSSIRLGEVYGERNTIESYTSFHSRGNSACFVYTFSQDKKAMILFKV